jgi:hypothetical protein
MRKKTTTLTHADGRTETFPSVVEAAAYLHVATPSLYRYAHNGRPYRKEWTVTVEGITPEKTPPKTWVSCTGVDPDGISHTFTSIKHAVEQTGLSRMQIESSYRRGRQVDGWLFSRPGIEPVRISLTEKRCTKCDTVHAADKFTVDNRTVDGLSFWCKPCANVARREYASTPQAIAKRAERLEKYAEKRRNARLIERVEAEPTYFLPRLVETVTLSD